MIKYIILFILLITLYKAEAQSSALELGNDLYAKGYYSKSIEAYQDHTNKADVYDKIAKAYIALGNYDKALLNYEYSVKANPDNTLFKFEYAKLLNKIKQYKAASDVFYTLVVTDSLNPNYHYELGLVLEKLKDSTTQDRFLKAFRLDSTHQKAIFRIAKHHLIKRHHKTVDDFIDIGLKSYANNKELISLKAQNFYWKEDYHKSIKWFEKLVELDERTLFVYEKLREIYIKVYNFEKAIEYGVLALNLDPKSPENMFALGQAYEQQALLYNNEDDYKNAEKYMKAAIEILDRPLDGEYLKLAGVYSSQKKYKEAIEVLQIAIKENPRNAFTYFRLVLLKEVYYEDVDAKIKAYEEFIKKFPKSRYLTFAQSKLSKLKEEKFLKIED
ncbi:hypothetical protein D7030_09140 [Flavobacteriaceae bacterium AU392]|nr:hypothetical protein D1817_15145 [Flavobacteriaceae bacterium]RKM84176.1 hypothetical protein D7030_09140 [Flavobacteriaceae bacterium AU392]